LTCTLMQILYDDLLDQLNNDHSTEEMEKLLEDYESLATTLRSMDESFSFPAFLTTFLNLFGLFWNGYRIAFLAKLLNIHST
ncbi:hypothetical protein CEXT_585911, partial [Caerostris extrusa]